MPIAITQEYMTSLVPLPMEILQPLNLPKETFEFLYNVGLPLHSNYAITPNIPLTFLHYPVTKKYPYLQHTYLHIASLDVVGELAINLHFQSVQQIQITNDCGYKLAILNLVNNSIEQFINCLGLWLSFYPRFRQEISKKLKSDPKFNLFEHEEIYKPILEKLKEIDPKAMREKKFFWRRMCEADIL